MKILAMLFSILISTNIFALNTFIPGEIISAEKINHNFTEVNNRTATSFILKLTKNSVSTSFSKTNTNSISTQTTCQDEGGKWTNIDDLSNTYGCIFKSFINMENIDPNDSGNNVHTVNNNNNKANFNDQSISYLTISSTGWYKIRLYIDKQNDIFDSYICPTTLPCKATYVEKIKYVISSLDNTGEPIAFTTTSISDSSGPMATSIQSINYLSNGTHSNSTISGSYSEKEVFLKDNEIISFINFHGIYSTAFSSSVIDYTSKMIRISIEKK